MIGKQFEKISKGFCADQLRFARFILKNNAILPRPMSAKMNDIGFQIQHCPAQIIGLCRQNRP